MGKFKSIAYSSVFCMVFCGAISVQANSYIYTVTALENYGATGSGSVVSITSDNTIGGSSNGHAVTWKYNDAAAVWEAPSRVENIYSSSLLFCINDDGKIAFIDIDLGYDRPHSWTQSGGVVNLDNGYGTPMSMNSSGEIAGHRTGSRPTYWDANSNPTTLMLYSGNTYAVPYSINDNGVLTGYAYEITGTIGGSYHALVWIDKNTAPLLLEGLTPQNNSIATMINNSNVIFGSSTSSGAPADSIDHQVIWDYNGGSWDLTFDLTADLNAIGATIKGVRLEQDGLYGFYESATGTLNFAKWSKIDTDWIREDLHVFSNEFDLWTNVTFADINGEGVIVGNGTYNGQTSVFAMTGTSVQAIPEPATLILLGLSGLAILRRRCQL